MKVHTKSAARKTTSALTVSCPQLLAGGSDRRFRQFVHDLLAFGARLQEARNRLGRLIGLSGSKYTVLIAIAHLQDQDGGVGINAVAEHLHLSGAFVTIETNGLLKAGLIVKKANPADGRRVLLSITPKARALLDRLATRQRPANDEIFGFLSAAEFEALRRLTPRLVESGDRALRLLDRPDGRKPSRIGKKAAATRGR